MPTFDDTWILPNASTSSATGFNLLKKSASSLRPCCLCHDDFHFAKNFIDTPTRPPCDDLLCAECTWLQRRRKFACQRCPARFICQSLEPASSSSELDGLPIPSHRTVLPDDGYDADDERGAVSNFQNLPVQQAHHDPSDSNHAEYSTSPGSELGRTHPQRSQNNHARKPTATPSSAQLELGGRKKKARRHRGRVNRVGARGAERNGRIKTQQRRETLNKT